MFTMVVAILFALVFAGLLYWHLMYRTRRLRSVVAQAARTPAQRRARLIAVLGGAVFAFGFGLIERPWPWVRTPSGAQLMWGCLIVGGLAMFAGVFAIGYTSDGPPAA